MQSRHFSVICLQSAVSAVQLFGNSIIGGNQGLLMPNFGNFFAAIENIEGQDEQVYSSDSHSFPVQEVTDLSSIWQGGFQGGIMSD